MRVTTHTYMHEASLKPSGRDAANRLDYFYVNGVLTDPSGHFPIDHQVSKTRIL